MSGKLTLSKVNEELPQNFRENLPRTLIYCAEQVCLGEYARAAATLHNFSYQFTEGFFSSDFVKSEVSETEEELKRFVDGVSKYYNEGTYSNEYRLEEYLSALLLGQLYWDYMDCQQKLNSACRVMQKLDTDGPTYFFRQCPCGLTLQTYLEYGQH